LEKDDRHDVGHARNGDVLSNKTVVKGEITQQYMLTSEKAWRGGGSVKKKKDPQKPK